MDSTGDRVKKFRESLNSGGKKTSQEAFGKVLGVSRSVIANIEYNKVEPTDLFIDHLCSVYGVNKDWLKTGDGEMIKPMTKDQQFHQILTDIEFSDDDLIKKIIQTYWTLDDKEKAAIIKLIDGLK